MKLYVAVTPDEYELPMIVADSAAELARRCGCKVHQVQNGITRNKHRQGRKFYNKATRYSFHLVEVEDE